ncbi:2-isopropylmalate synthase [Pirellula sp. SH-Sr6A]|uniref:citramalate synthase n=1 Tax=Pirellula sp. SH-Sr6A TaxID=1632865 RepID=UPI00078CE09A|nr:citramalate synthase [Pirellula sp. SH-Sr6A]AMV30620.1 2-isopropylmalate synthase [Pirellula sp. SH-Sr6A]
MTKRAVHIYDTTLRDGTQGEGVSLSLQDKLNIAERLAEFGIDMIEGGYPLSNEKDAMFFRKVKQLKLGNSLVSAFGMTRRRGLAAADDPGMKALVAAETPVITVVGKSWDFHATEVLGVSLQENVDMIAESVEFLGRHAQVVYDAEHFFDGYKANREYALQAVSAAAKAGAQWIVFCDTNGGTLPEEIAAIVSDAKSILAPLGVRMGIHCHNDGDLATANSLAAIDAGCDQVQGTINGIGERCGNADLVAIMANLQYKKTGYSVLDGRPLDHLTELSRYVYETANLQLRSGQPFVGRSAFAHKGGMHVHAVNKFAHTYEHMDPAKIGNERRILVSELSGRSNIAALMQDSGLPADRATQDRILAEIVSKENQGYQFEAAEGSFELLVKKCTGSYQPHFETIKYQVLAGDIQAQTAEAYAEAILKVQVQGTVRVEAAEGHGPVNAMDAALRKALLPSFPQLDSMRLVDFKVRVVNGEAGTAARIRVNIESADDQKTWRTIGVSENIIEASWQALVDAFECKLHR